jgi:tetratricopeptide (TPR) repeat protein
MRDSLLRIVRSGFRAWLLRFWIDHLPRLLASLTREGATIFPIAGILFLLITFAPWILIPLRVGSIQISLGLIQFSIDVRQLAPHGLWIGFMLFLIWAVGRWATPRARFWKELETRGIRVVWDGEERDFRERLDEAMGFSLGRGPSERILPYYVSRPEEANVLRILEEKVWTRPKVVYGVVIAGPPVAGKTRTAMELMIRLNLPFVLVWPRDKKEGTPFFPSKVALPVRRAVVLADDLSLSPGGEGPSIPKELMAFLSACPGLALIATAREDRIPPDVRGVAVVRLQEMNWNADLEALARAVAQAEQAEDPDEVRSRFTGHPGSLAAGLKRFEQRYAELSEEIGRVLGVQEKARRDRLGEIGRRFLQAARALWDLGVRTLTLERIWAVVEKARGGTVAAADRSDVQSALEKLSFLRAEQEKRLEVLRFYEGILTEVIRPRKEWEETAWETLRERRDAEAFVEIGSTWSRVYSRAYQGNPRKALRRAIDAYMEALRIWTPNVAPRNYAMVQNNLGVTYRRLADYENPRRNLRQAIAAFEQALRFRTAEDAPLDYAETQNELGIAYRNLAEYEDPVGNLRKAIEACKEALRFRTPRVAQLDYVRTQNSLGLAYWNLAEHEDPMGNLRKAIESYEEALRFCAPEVAPLDYAMTQNNLGIAYWNLAEHEDPVGNLRKAIEAYQEALRFYAPEVASLDYAMTQNNLGIAYSSLAEHEDPVGNLRKAIEAYQEALRFYTPERTPLDHGRVQNNLGVAYRDLAAHEDPMGNLRQAIAAFEQALRFRTAEDAPLDYAETQNELGIAYRNLAKHEDSVGNLGKAFKAYGEALRFYTPEVAPLDYAKVQHNIGVAYRSLAEYLTSYEDELGNLERALQAFEEALRFRTPETAPFRYAETQHEIGLAYRRRAELQKDPIRRCVDLGAAVRAFREALRFRTPQNTPRWHAQTSQALREAEDALRQAGCPEAG